MLVAILSDSHDNMDLLRKAVDLCNGRQAEVVLHAGDFVAPFVMRELQRLSGKLIGVFGNNDGERLGLQKRIQEAGGEVHPLVYRGELDGRRVFLTHEPEVAHPVARSGMYDVVIHGHNHAANVESVGSTLLVNPGEVGGWLTGRATMAFLDTAALSVEIVDL